MKIKLKELIKHLPASSAANRLKRILLDFYGENKNINKIDPLVLRKINECGDTSVNLFIEIRDKLNEANGFNESNTIVSKIKNKITLRDKIAKSAMQGILSSYDGAACCYDMISKEPEFIAKCAYALADAMLNERNKKVE